MQIAKTESTIKGLKVTDKAILWGDIGGLISNQSDLWTILTDLQTHDHNEDYAAIDHTHDDPSETHSHDHATLTNKGTKTHAELESELADIQADIPVSVSDETEKDFASPNYILSRGQNLITNGSGLLENNYNFMSFGFDPIETYGGAGSFMTSAILASHFSSEYIPIDPTKIYELKLCAKTGDADGSNYLSTYTQFFGVALYDIDKNIILPSCYSKRINSVDTELAQELKTGDTVMYLNSTSNWYDGTSSAYREFSWWPYTNENGYTYPDYTYTQNISRDLTGYGGGAGTWGSGGISGNTITLSAAWPGPNLPAGTKIRNSYSTGAYKYLFSGSVSNTWQEIIGSIGRLSQAVSYNFFAPGTAFARLVFLSNYSGDGVSTNNLRISNISFSEIRDEHRMTAKSSDRDDPPAGSSVVWQSDGTDSGNDGDILIKITDSAGITTTGKINITSI